MKRQPLQTGLVLAALVGIAILPVLPARAQDITVEEILANHYDALGGMENLQAVDTMVVSGRMTLPQGMEAPFTRYAKRPNQVRLEFTIQGMTGVQAYDGETAWMLMPFMGKTDPEPMPATMAEAFELEADFDGPLVNYEEKGNQVELVGTEEVEGAEAYKLKVTLSNGDVQHHFIDAEYFLPLRMQASQEVQGQEVEVVTTLSDFKQVGDLMVPHSMQVTGMMGQQTITVDEVKLDVEIPDEKFAMPEMEMTEGEESEGEEG